MFFQVQAKDNFKEELFAAFRPILFRSEFLSKGNLRVFKNHSLSPLYDIYGFPKFNPIFTYKLKLSDTQLAQSKYYRSDMLDIWAKDIAKRPDIFSKKTIRMYKQYLSGKLPKSKLTNPILKTGEMTRVHHARDGYELVRYSEHKLSHTGGNSTYGYKYTCAAQNLPGRETYFTAVRWGQFTALELAFSSLGLALTGERKISPYLVNGLASTTSGLVAFSVESLLIDIIPLSKGGTPMFIAGYAINLGGFASWLAAGAFMLTKYAIISGWQYYQQQQAIAVEQACKEAEKYARFYVLKAKSTNNTKSLQVLAKNL